MSNKTVDYTELQQVLGYVFVSPTILTQALTHRSYVNENREVASLGHNERLEFLGDAVLELIVTEYLFQKYPDSPEGDLTAYRSALVNSDSLAAVALDLGLGKYILLSRGESKDTGRARTYILANSCEAILGALYIDGGYVAAETVVKKYIIPRLDDVIKNKSWIDAKSLFQSRAQEYVSQTPTYKTVKETGPDHDKQFTVGVYIGTEQIGLGMGNSKQDAEQQAARAALEAKGWL